MFRVIEYIYCIVDNYLTPAVEQVETAVWIVLHYTI